MALELDTDLDVSTTGAISLLPEGSSEDFESVLDRHLSRELAAPALAMETTAKRVHRYKSKTGKMTGGTHVDVGSSVGSESISTNIQGYVDDSVEYSRYVIDGHGSWSGDNFFENALESNTSSIEDAVSRAIIAAVNETFGGV